MLRHNIKNLFNLSTVLTKQLIKPMSSLNKYGNLRQKPILEQLALEYQDISPLAPIIKNDSVKNIDITEWRKRISLFKLYDFRDSDFFKIIGSFPQVLEMSVKDVNDILNQWSSCNLGSSYFKKMIIIQPQFLTLHAKEVRKRIAFLHSICKTREMLVNFLIECPSIMFNDWESILLKLDFLLKKKRIPFSEVFACHALSVPLELLQFRFYVLEKCGVFKRQVVYPHKKNKHDTMVRKNPNLYDISDVSDHYFANNVAKITLEEFEVCREIFNGIESDSDKNEEYNCESDSDEND